MVDVASAPAEQEGEAGPLPEFLSDDEERESAQPTTIGRNSSMPPNDIMSRDGSGRPAFAVVGTGVQRRSPFLLARLERKSAGREGFEPPRS